MKTGIRAADAVILLVLVILIGAVSYFLVFPQYTAWMNDAKSITKINEKIASENEVYRTLAQTYGALFFLLTAFFTWRTVRASEQSARAAERNYEVAQQNLRLAQNNINIGQANLELTQERQVTERFTRAIELFGKPEASVHILGALYSLERLATDYPDQHWTIVQVLTGWLQVTAPKDDKLVPDDAARHPDQKEPIVEVSAVLAVLSNLCKQYQWTDDRRLNLKHLNLSGANLRNTHFEGAQFDFSDLSGADLEDAHLEDASLLGANLGRQFDRRAFSTRLVRAHLERANLFEAHLEGALLSGAFLQGANLTGAHLNEAHLASFANDRIQIDAAHFDEHTKLLGVDLTDANLADVTGLTRDQIQDQPVTISARTRLPSELR